MKFTLDLDSAFGRPHSYVLFLSTSFLVCSSPQQHEPIYMYSSTLYKAYHLNTITNQHIILAHLVQKVVFGRCQVRMSTGTPNIRTRDLSRLPSVPSDKFRDSTAFRSRPLPVMSLADSLNDFNVYWTVHRCNSSGMKNQLDVTSYFISLIMRSSTCFGH